MKFLQFLKLFILNLFFVSITTFDFAAEKDILFLLRIRNRPFKDEEVFTFDNRVGLRNSSFDPNKMTTFVAHGFTESRKTKHQLKLSKAILDSDDQNLFYVDWSVFSQTFIYEKARRSVGETGKVVGEFINYMVENVGLKLENLVLIGFSLGAHVMGMAGKSVNGQVRKVIGLDPAGPLFDVNDPDNRLSLESAKYTECIHTGFPLGIQDPICHVDFYVNKGTRQPGCVTVFGTNNIICSHYRAVEIATEVMTNPKAFYGYRCEDKDAALFGNCKTKSGAFINDRKNEEENLKGIFNVETNDEMPFGRGSQE